MVGSDSLRAIDQNEICSSRRLSNNSGNFSLIQYPRIKTTGVTASYAMIDYRLLQRAPNHDARHTDSSTPKRQEKSSHEQGFTNSYTCSSDIQTRDRADRHANVSFNTSSGATLKARQKTFLQ
jgi:hypothetical protein